MDKTEYAVVGLFVLGLVALVFYVMRGRKKIHVPERTHHGFDNKIHYSSPTPGRMGVPVPASTLRTTNERYKLPFYKAHYAAGLPADATYDRMPNGILSTDTFRPYGPNTVPHIPFFSSVSAYSPLPEVNTPWEKAGILTTDDTSDDTILNLYRRPIAPLQDLWEYSVQDKDGIIIPLKGITYLENGDGVSHVDGKDSKGSWTAKIYVNDKWVVV